MYVCCQVERPAFRRLVVHSARVCLRLYFYFQQDNDSTDVEVSEKTENQNGKGSTFIVTVVNDSVQGMHEWTEEETHLLKQAVEV